MIAINFDIQTGILESVWTGDVDLKEIVEANLKSLKEYDAIIDAMVLANPHDTAMSILYQELSATNKYFFNVFATREKAIDWLNNY